jgi:uncharacterized LabA/DUF88 family protein
MIDNGHRPGRQDLPAEGPKLETAEALLRSGPPQRASFYIDGFNLYHGIDDLGDDRLKWLNLDSLCRSFLRENDQLASINFFTALSRWDKAKRQRHIAYINAIEHTGVMVHLGTFDRPSKFCWEKNDYCRNFHEKKTDVAIAVSLLGDGFEDKYDKAFLVSADSDQVPLAERFRDSLPHKMLLHIAPPRRISEGRELAQTIGHSFHLTAGRLREHLLPQDVRSGTGRLIVTRPGKYA